MQPPMDIETNEPKPTKWCWFARLVRRAKGRRPVDQFSSLAQAALDDSSAPTGGHGTLYRAGLTLAELKPGECGTVRRLFGPTPGRLRLLEMGLTPGTHIRVIRTAAFGGPLDILVRGYQLSLRLQEAAGVWLDDEDEEAETVLTTALAESGEIAEPGARDISK